MPAQPLLGASPLINEIVAVINEQLDLVVDAFVRARPAQVRLPDCCTRDRERVDRVRLPRIRPARRSGTVSFGGTRTNSSPSLSSCLAALAAFEHATPEMGLAAGSAEWVRSGLSDDRWDRRVPTMAVGTVAPSSQRMTANGEALRVDELVAFLHEAVQPPTPAPVVILSETGEASATGPA
jgi:hypothetical protein